MGDLGVDGKVIHYSCVNAVIMGNIIFLNVTPCSVIEICQPFIVNFCLRLYYPEDGSTMFLERLINFYKTDSATSKKTAPFVLQYYSPLSKWPV